MTERRIPYRWTVCALLFVATTINYIDRQVLGILAPTLQRELAWSESDYGDIVSAFSFAYAIGFLIAGRLLDRVGVRRGLAAAVVAWSLAAIGHAFARTVAGFSLVRAMLGLGESAIFPGSIKAVAEWFPQKERALATGIFNAGTNTGAILTPLIVPWITLTWGWQWAFIVTGALGFVWLVLWIPLYREDSSEVLGPRSEVGRVAAAPTVPWASLFGYRQTWAFVAGKLLADPVWWFYLYWLPKFLDTKYGVQLAQVAMPIIAVYLIADVGSVGGGWLSGVAGGGAGCRGGVHAPRGDQAKREGVALRPERPPHRGRIRTGHHGPTMGRPAPRSTCDPQMLSNCYLNQRRQGRRRR
jgi:MFS transporter, ACS family, hexuronate transporter